ncbi:MAG: GntR family transcriptional regulator [Butyrivibrio sp.]
MMIKIDVGSSKPLYEQIVDSIKNNYVRGYLKPGDEIPSVRKLAMQLSVTPNTVAKAYQELERCKVIVTIRGKGTYISDSTNIKIDSERMEHVEKELTTQIVELTYMGMDRQEILDLVDKIYREIKEEK